MKRLREENINTKEYFDDQFDDKPVDKVNLLRQEKYLEHVKNGDKVVELGCGLSYFPEMARLHGAYSYGLDFSEKAVNKLIESFPKTKFVIGDATKTPFDNAEFDVVVSGEVLEHIEVPQTLIDEMARICRPGGKIIISTPHLEFDDPEHIWEFDEKDLQEMMGKYGETKVETLKSTKFPGREYIIAVTTKV
ncbi:class I SAM-dependent methyltransferase [Candidatus Woesebacteria bacterium]|nr:class I SAM-dependent methyltransferase [Candidatus Woesebacteria bacterium]